MSALIFALTLHRTPSSLSMATVTSAVYLTAYEEVQVQTKKGIFLADLTPDVRRIVRMSGKFLLIFICNNVFFTSNNHHILELHLPFSKESRRVW
jgi:urate oxidase